MLIPIMYGVVFATRLVIKKSFSPHDAMLVRYMLSSCVNLSKLVL